MPDEHRKTGSDDAAPTAEPGVTLRAHPGLPAPRAVHVLHPEARVSLEKGVLRIDRPAEAPVHLRLPEVTGLAVHGPATVTTPSVHALLRAGIPLIWRSLSGHYVGQATDLSGGSSRRRRAQYGAQNGDLGRAIAARLVEAKILNMRALRRRRAGLAADRREEALRRLDRLAAQATCAGDLDALRGFEGAATALYFACWPELGASGARRWRFPGRRRRPPQGMANALLSYCGAVVTGECAAAALAAGLDVAEGFLHAARAGRPALALDLVEPFRPAVSDSVVLALLNTGGVEAEADDEGPCGVPLGDANRRKVLEALERRLASPAPGGRGDWRAAIARAAQSLAEALVAGRAEQFVLPVQR